MEQVTELFLHPPDKIAAKFVAHAERIYGSTGITFGCILDERIIPLRPGDLVAVVARPGHGKSSLLAYLTKRAVEQVPDAKDQKKCAVYVTWDQPVEQMETYFQIGAAYNSSDLAWGRVPPELVKREAIKRAELPIWLVGHSLADAKTRKPPLTANIVYEAIRAMRQDYGYEPLIVCLDYLQKIPVKGYRTRLEQVTEATYQANDLAKDIGVPVVVGVQASRDTDGRRDPIPNLGDAQHSSAIEQEADKQLSLFRPIKVKEPGEAVTVGGREYTVDEALTLIRLVKQRGEKGYGTWAVRFEPHTLRMSDYTSVVLD